MKLRLGAFVAPLSALLLSACGHASPSSSEPPDTGALRPASDAGEAPKDQATSADASDAPDAERTPAAAAAAKAAESSAECKAIGSFYWEVGDAKGVVASGSIGGSTYTASTPMPIASASKLVWGAYVVERFKNDLTAIDMAKMTMRSGYTSFASPRCAATATVAGCLNLGDNGTHNPADDGFFTYGGGHFEKYAVELGLGLKTNTTLAAELASQLGPDLAIAFENPVPAYGIRTTPGDYGRFLRKVIDGTLALGKHLGEGAVCTLPSACPNAHESSSPEAWHYSYGHWIEDDPTAGGDGAFSSPGVYGFYPWIASTKDLYGIVARHATSGLVGPAAGTAYWKSALCGRTIRQAFVAAR
jgi:hypothetical protein